MSLKRWSIAAGAAALLFLALFFLLRSGPLRAEIAYSAYADGYWTVYRQAGPSSPPRAVAPGAGGDQNAPAISPDGKSVAFDLAGRDVQVCALDSSTCVTVAAPAGTSVRPTWHPRTGEISFVNYVVAGGREDSDIHATSGGRTTTAVLLTQTGNQDYPALSPDGSRLAYASGLTVGLRGGGVQVIQQLWVMDLRTGLSRQLLLSNARDIHPDWSRDGRRIAFASDRTGQFEIWVVDVETGQQRQITDGEGVKTWPAWSPEGKSILFTLAKDGREGLALIDEDGSNPRPFRPFGPDSDIQTRDADWR